MAHTVKGKPIPSDGLPVSRYNQLRDELLSAVADCEHSEHEVWWKITPRRMERHVLAGNEILEFKRHEDYCYFGVEQNLFRLNFKSPTRTGLDGFPLIVHFGAIGQDPFRSTMARSHYCSVNGFEGDMTDEELQEAYRWVHHIDGTAVELTVAIVNSR